MPPSPVRKRVRRHFSASSAPGHRWKGAPFASLRRRESSPSSSSRGRRNFSPEDRSEDSDYEEDGVSHVSASEDNLIAHAQSFAALSQSDRPPLTYASLPPTPISSSPPRIHTPPLALPRSGPTTARSEPTVTTKKHEPNHEEPPFSLWDYLREELLATDFDSHQELKWERVSNFLSMPYAMEKIFLFGFILCFDSWLYTFTILPIRFALASFRLFTNTLLFRSTPLPPSQKADILRTLLLIISIVILAPLTDASQIYHFIRGQDTIKLYVIFNALEIADRLCASIGQDIIDCLFSRSTLEVISHRKVPTSHTLRPVLYFILALIYNVAHALVMVYQLISLNVAVNSYDHALLTLLVSNQFVEIKGSVFKKFEKDNLFQITCADIVERFTLFLMLVIVAFRNLIQLSGAAFNFSEGFTLPQSFGWFRGGSVWWTISYPVLAVMASEMLVDWLKHAFIAKFNHIRPSVYERYTDVLCRDLASGSAAGRRGARKHTYVDQSPLVARRLGFASLPLAVFVILMGSQSINMLIAMHTDNWSPWTGAWNVKDFTDEDWVNVAKWTAMGIMFWVCTVVIKLIMGVRLLSYATRRRSGMEARIAADSVNDFGRDPIGEGQEERKYNRDLKTLLDNKRDDATPVAEIGERKPEQNGKSSSGGDKKKRLELEEITRFTMVKRIW
ncbi:eukaryotic membrane protein family-domain-containing protein [Cristinia sonorae]|uniref:Eukaryotic membrane protein family-domain-containing protein n=1 Tax=Cristinia sonorae TaxID=1940300 RepID=A0A8K0UFV3_9AGAR|nr:eukaryotic membrane protein family-domain-containing protein [Cristinia sonorae]